MTSRLMVSICAYTPRPPAVEWPFRSRARSATSTTYSAGSRSSLRSSRLTADAERIAATRDLQAGTDASRSDELGRLAAAFNTMLGALADSLSAQRQLVADASHELRTPLTTARTSLESLQRHPEMAAEDQADNVAVAINELQEDR